MAARQDFFPSTSALSSVIMSTLYLASSSSIGISTIGRIQDEVPKNSKVLYNYISPNSLFKPSTSNINKKRTPSRYTQLVTYYLLVSNNFSTTVFITQVYLSHQLNSMPL
jgi:hypothetical protein